MKNNEKIFVIRSFRGTCSSVKILKGYILVCWSAVGVMLICRNAEGVHGKKKVGNPCFKACGPINEQADSRWPTAVQLQCDNCYTSTEQKYKQIKQLFITQHALQSTRKLSLFLVRKHIYSRLSPWQCTKQVIFQVKRASKFCFQGNRSPLSASNCVQ